MACQNILRFSWVLAGTLIVGATVSGPADAQTEILFNTYYSQKHPIMRGTAKPFAMGVEKATKGRVKVKFPAATLASPRKQWGMLTGGIADATSGSISWIRKRVALTEIAALPFMVPSARGASVALWRTHEKFFKSRNEYKGVKLLSL